MTGVARFAAAAMFGLTATAVAQQQAPAEKPPKKGDRVVVRGCVSGPVLEATDTKTVDATGGLSASVTYRLTGDKTLLKQMRADDEGRLVEIVGVLKSELPQGDARRSKQVGRTRIVVGISTPQSSQPQGPPPMPVLEVKSYEALGAPCRR